MATVTVSPKYQIVIPAQMRKDFAIDTGKKLQVISFKDRIELLPVHKMKTTRSFLKKMAASFKREHDRT